ncbi:MAG: ABC transporter substrate-binding protein [Clostridiaceae bacterium]|nr:ABC transporter substrate-binding protein [Clostridiaceae bacterium]
MKYKSWKKIFVIMLISIMCITNVAAAHSSVDTLTISIHTDENTLTPFTYVRGYPGIEVARLVFDSLFTLDANNQVIPWMVEEYSVDENFQVYELTLRDDLKWHDGEKVTTEDVKFAFEYALTQNSSRWRRIASEIEEMEILDERNIIITLENSNLDFISNGLADFMIYPKHIYDGVEDATLVEETVGSGMYQLLEYRSEQYYKFKAVEDYFMGTPKVKNITMPIINDSGANFQALRAGEIAATTAQLAPELVETFEGNRNINIKSGPGFGSTLLQFNTEEYPFNDSKFRQAIAYAIDIDELIERITLGYADKGNLGFYHPNSPYGRQTSTHSYNIEKSNELLDMLGFTEKNAQGIRLDAEGTPLEFELLVNGGSAPRSRTAEIIISQLMDVGIKVNIVALEGNTLDDRVWPGFDVSHGRNYEMSIWGWSGPMQLNSDALIRLFASDFAKGNLNIGGYNNDVFDDLAEKFAKTLNLQDRDDLIQEMMEVIEGEVPFLTLYYGETIMAYDSTKYDGWVMQDGMGIINKFSFLDLDTAVAQEGVVSTEVEEVSNNQSSSFPWWVVLVLIIPATLILKRRKNREDDEEVI